MKIDWKRKLTSRKWWIAVASFIVGCMLLFGVDSNIAQQWGGVVLLAADVVAYTLGESFIDAQQIGGQDEGH